MNMDEHIEKFLKDLQDQGFSVKTESWENRSKIWGPKAFRTTIRKGRMSRHFDTCAGAMWSSRTNVQAFRTLQDVLGDIVGYGTYNTWSQDTREYYSELLGKRSARTYFIEMKQKEHALHEVLGDHLFEQFCNLDQ